MNIGEVHQALLDGKKVRRAGWNGNGMWLILVTPGNWSDAISWSNQLDRAQFIGMRTADSKFVPWLCSQTDFFATDWEVAV